MRLTFIGKDPESADRQAADLREPAAVLKHPDTQALIDFDRPVAVLCVAGPTTSHVDHLMLTEPAA